MGKRETTSEETRFNDFELTLDELETVTAGSGKSGGKTSGHTTYLQFDFKTVFVTNISWS